MYIEWEDHTMAQGAYYYGAPEKVNSRQPTRLLLFLSVVRGSDPKSEVVMLQVY